MNDFSYYCDILRFIIRPTSSRWR